MTIYFNTKMPRNVKYAKLHFGGPPDIAPPTSKGRGGASLLLPNPGAQKAPTSLPEHFTKGIWHQLGT